jgi:alanine racemase
VDIRTSIRPTVAEIDLGALRRNVARLRTLVGPGVAIYGVVKADAYGHGAVAVGRALAPLCDALAVSLVEEGLELREAGIAGPIMVLGAYFDRYQSEVLEEGLTPVVYQAGDLQRFAEAPVRRHSARHKGPIDLHVKIDTGMNRLGIAVDELPGVLDRAAGLARVRVAGVCTHFASADLAEEEPTREQLALFESCLEVARARGPVLAHAANSAAAARFAEARFDAVRPGLALYGAMPSAVVALPELEPVLTLRSRIMALHEVPPGGAVSYGGIWRAARPSRVATLPLGYADGYPRHVRGAEVMIRGRRVPIVGAVCMDMLMVDVTDVPGAQVADPVTLLGREGTDTISVDELARWAGTVNYEILCGISKRVPRLYRDEEPA